MKGRNDEDWAVFWCSLLSPLLLGEIPERRRERYFQKLCQEERRLPNGQRRRLSVRTLRRQWRRLKDGGVSGLYRRRRSDRGKPRKKHADLLARAVVLKKEQPRRSDKVLNRILKREFGRSLPRSTLYAHLRREGATRLKLGVSKQKIRCRWTRDQPGALWVGDFEHGPLVMHQGESCKTHLSAWIDCHSRYLVEGRYYVRENLDILADSLLRAWGNHGASREVVRGQRQDLPRQGTPTGVCAAQHQTLTPAAARSSGGRADRAFLSNLPGTIRGRGACQRPAHPGGVEPPVRGLAAAGLPPGGPQRNGPDAPRTLPPRAAFDPASGPGRRTDLLSSAGAPQGGSGLLRRPSGKLVLRRRSDAPRRSRDRGVRPLLDVGGSAVVRAPAARIWAVAGVISARREAIPSPHPCRPPAPSPRTISTPCGPPT